MRKLNKPSKLSLSKEDIDIIVDSFRSVCKQEIELSEDNIAHEIIAIKENADDLSTRVNAIVNYLDKKAETINTQTIDNLNEVVKSQVERTMKRAFARWIGDRL